MIIMVVQHTPWTCELLTAIAQKISRCKYIFPSPLEQAECLSASICNKKRLPQLLVFISSHLRHFFPLPPRVKRMASKPSLGDQDVSSTCSALLWRAYISLNISPTVPVLFNSHSQQSDVTRDQQTEPFTSLLASRGSVIKYKLLRNKWRAHWYALLRCGKDWFGIQNISKQK